MPFKKEFTKQMFLDAVTDEYQPTSVIMKKVGCQRDCCRQNLLKLAEENLIDMMVIEGMKGKTGHQYMWKNIKGGHNEK